MDEVFVSYASADRARVEPLVHALEAHGCNVWWDRDIALGDTYHRVIERALAQAKCVIVVWSAQSIESEWVTNEASEARKRGILVPLLLDAVVPPLEFRHLQSASFVGWRSRPDDPEFQQLMTSVRGVLQRAGVSLGAGASRALRAKSWWETPAGWALGAAALIVAAGVLVMALRQAGLVGTATDAGSADVASRTAPAPPPASRDRATQPAVPVASPAPGGAAGARVSAGDMTNLFDVRQGAQIVAANEAGWKDYIYSVDRLACANITSRGFVTFAFAGERPARFGRLGVYVESTSDLNVKTLELYASEQSDQGPFGKVATVTVPNYRNERQPFHEFTFAPVTARYARVVLVDWQGGARLNGNVCTIALYGTLQ